MNTVTLTGRLTKDPNTNFTRGRSGTTVSSFTLAVQRRTDKDKADFIRVVSFGKLAEDVVDKYFCKGMRVGVVGWIQTGSYENKDGQTVYTTDIIAEELEFLDTKKDAK